MSKSSLLKRLVAAGVPAAAKETPPEAARPGAEASGYLSAEERAKDVFAELYPNASPDDYPRAVYAIVKGLRDAEAGAVAFSDRSMFQKGAEEATRQILAIVNDPGVCVDPVTHQPVTSHFDWRNVTSLIAERIGTLKIRSPK